METAFGNSSSAYPYALPIVTTLSASSIDTTFATGNGNVTSIMGDTVTVRGLLNYAYTGTDKLIGDADVTMKADTGRYGRYGPIQANSGRHEIPKMVNPKRS